MDQTDSYVEYGYQEEDQDVAVLRELMRTNGFNEDDLAQNRLGRMSVNQMLTLIFRALLAILGVVVSLLGVAAMAITAVTVSPYIITKVRLMLSFGGYVMAFLGAIVFGFIAVVINFLLHSERLLLSLVDLAARKVLSSSGRISTSRSEEIEDGLHQVMRFKTQTYFYVIRGESYPVSEEAFEALTDHAGAIFRVYYAPRSRFLLSIEPDRGQ